MRPSLTELLDFYRRFCYVDCFCGKRLLDAHAVVYHHELGHFDYTKEQPHDDSISMGKDQALRTTGIR